MRESSNLEFKEKYSRSYLKTVSAFANYGTGEILFGVNDQGKIVGVDDIDKLCLSIENAINDSISPVPIYEIFIESNIVKLKVYEGLNKPYFCQSKAFRRADSSTVEVDRMELTRLILEGKNITFDSLLSDIRDLEFTKLESMLKEKLGIKALSKDILITLGLYLKDNGYTKAGELLSDTNSFRGVDLVKFGESISIFLDRLILENCSILDQYEKSVEKFKQYFIYEEIVGSKRVTKELIPEFAFREAIANALVHRTWDVNSQIKVEMYKDRIEVISPGGLPKGLTEEEYLSGRISILRNPIIADVFYRLYIIEKFGTGIQRIFESYVESSTKPQFEFSDNYIRITLPIIKHGYPEIAKDKLEVYKVVENSELSSGDIVKATGFGKTKTVEILNDLVDQGFLEKRGRARGTKYKVRKL